MAIRSVRSARDISSQTGISTGLIWVLNNGTATMESHRNVGDGNGASAVLGKCLNEAGDQTAQRLHFPVVNSRAIAVIPPV